MTPLCEVTYSTISNKAPRLTSFHFRSLSGSATKSNRTQHCWIFCTNNSSLSAGVASIMKITLKNYVLWSLITLKNTFEQWQFLYFAIFGNVEARRALPSIFYHSSTRELYFIDLCWRWWSSRQFGSRRGRTSGASSPALIKKIIKPVININLCKLIKWQNLRE